MGLHSVRGCTEAENDGLCSVNLFYIKMEKAAILGLFYGEYECSLSVKNLPKQVFLFDLKIRSEHLH